MSKKIRYLILGIGFLTFCLLAPLIIFYVTGVTYDFQARQFRKTGIILLATDPKTLDVYLDGKLAEKQGGNLKFLLPGEYLLALEKDGYFGWQKHLEVKDGQVTRGSLFNNKIYLFFNNPQSSVLAKDALDFEILDNNIVYLTPSSLTISNLTDSGDSRNFPLPKAVNPVRESISDISPASNSRPATSQSTKPLAFSDGVNKIAALSGSQTALLITQTDAKNKTTNPVLLADLSKQTVSDISSLGLSPENLKFSGDGQLYDLENGNLFTIDYQNLRKNLAVKNVLAFGFQGDNLYYLTLKTSGASLEFLPKKAGDSTVLASGIPEFSKGEILVNFNKEIFLLLDNSLYQVGSPLQKLADNVEAWQFNPEDSSLIFSHSGQLDYYNPLDRQVHFITRSQSPIKLPLLKTNLGRAFFVRDTHLASAELDTRDRQNEYDFYAGTDPQKLQMDSQNQNLVILDNGELKILRIR